MLAILCGVNLSRILLPEEGRAFLITSERALERLSILLLLSLVDISRIKLLISHTCYPDISVKSRRNLGLISL